MNRVIARRAFALVFAFLLVTSIPFATVELGGPDVSPVGPSIASHGGTHIDDFEDGDTNVETSGWSGWADSGVSNLGTTTSDPLEGTTSGKYDGPTGTREQINVTPDSAKSSSRVGVLIEQRQDTNGEQRFALRDGGNLVAFVDFESNGGLQVGDGNTQTSVSDFEWHPNVTYRIEIRDIDWSGDTYDVYVNGDQVYNDASFWTAANSYDEVEFDFVPDAGNQYVTVIDDLQTEGSAFSPSGTTSGTLDDFEDNDATVEASGWEGYRVDGSITITSTSSDVISGTYSGKFDAAASTDSEAQIVSEFGETTASRYAIRIRIPEDNLTSSSDAIRFELQKGDTAGPYVDFDHDNDIVARSGASETDLGIDWVPGSTHEVEFRDVNFSADTYDIYVDGTKFGDDLGFQNSISGADQLSLRMITQNSGNSQVAIVDDVEIGGSAYTISDRNGGVVIDDFDSGDLTSTASGWSNWKNATDLSTNTTESIFGSHSADLSNNNANSRVEIFSESGTYQPDRVALSVRVTDNFPDASDKFDFEIYSGDTKTLHVGLHGDNLWEDGNGANIGEESRPFITYHIELRDIDWSADTYDIYVNGEQYANDVAFTNAADSMDNIRLLLDTDSSAEAGTVKVDRLEINGTGNTDATWQTGTTEDFEDGNLDVETDNWGPQWYGATGDLTVESSSPIDGSHSLNMTTSSARNTVRLHANNTVDATSISFKTRISSDVADSSDSVFFNLRGKENTLFLQVEFEDSTGDIHADDGASTLIDTGHHWSPGVVYTIEIKNIDWSADTYDLYINGTKVATGWSFRSSQPDGYMAAEVQNDVDSSLATRSVYWDSLDWGTCSSNCQFGASGAAAAGNTVSGYVLNQHGDPIQNATVQVWGVDYSQITPDAGETKKQKAIDLIEQAQNKTPSEWIDQIESNFQLQSSPGFPDRGTGHLETVEKPYAVVHEVEDWKKSSFSPFAKDNPTLQEPLLTISADRGEAVKLAVSAWDPTKSSIRNAISPVKNDLPGEPIESQIVIETLVAADGSTGDIQTTKTQIDCNFVGCDWSSAFVEVQLTPGFYRVYPKGHSETGYVIKVGDPIEIIADNLESQTGKATDQASDVAQKVTDGKFTKTTTTTNATGQYSVSTGSDVKTVAVQAYKASDVSVNDSSLEYQSIIDEYEGAYDFGDPTPEIGGDFSVTQTKRLGSVYLPSDVKRADPPASNVNVTVHETTFPPHGDQLGLNEQLEDILAEMLNETLAETFGPFLDRIEDVDRTDLESIYEILVELYESNQDLQDRVNDATNDTTDTNITIVDNPDDPSNGELQDTIDELYDQVVSLGNQLEAEIEEDVGTDTISQTWSFENDLKEESVAVLIHWSNGSTTTLDLESPYLSLNKRPGLGDQVLLEDYPINGTDPATLTFEILAVGEDEGQIGRIRNTVRNPKFDGNIPTLDAIELTSLEPGPNDQVDIELHPEDAAKFGSIVSVTVTGPGGESISTDSITSNGRASGFKTSAGAGVYHVAIKFNNTDGDEFTETLRIRADDFDDDRPPSAQIRTGPTGRYLVVGDGLESGTIDVADDGSVTVATQIQQGADVPGSIQLYLQSLDTGSRQEVTVKVVRGSSQTAVSSQIGVILHMNQIDPERAVLYREETDPLPRDGVNSAGQVDARENGTTIQTFTESDGKVTVFVENDPGLLERGLYRFRLLDLPIVGTIFVPLDLGLGLSSSSTAGGLVAIGLLAGGVRRWNA